MERVYAGFLLRYEGQDLLRTNVGYEVVLDSYDELQAAKRTPEVLAQKHLALKHILFLGHNWCGSSLRSEIRANNNKKGNKND